MNRPGFIEGVIVAIIFSLIVAAVFTVMSAFFPTRWLLQAVITGSSFMYVLYLLYRSKEKRGRVAVTILWLVYALSVWVFAPSTLIILFAHVGAIWLVRTLFYHNSLLVASFDFGLITISVFVSIWTLMHTHSLLLTTWVFFLLQAVFSILPEQIQLQSKTVVSEKDDEFERAYAVAEAAVRQLSNQH